MSSIEKDIHYHIYQRSISNKEVYRCIDPDCKHYQPKREFLVGKRARCVKCKELFIITQKQVKAGHQRPGHKDLVCLTCSNSKKGKILRIVETQLEGILADLSKENNPFNSNGGGI